MQYIYNKIGLERIRVLFMDTNAFYYAAGLSNGDIETEKLREYISQNEVAISSVSFYEFLTKFKNKSDKLKLATLQINLLFHPCKWKFISILSSLYLVLYLHCFRCNQIY